MQFIWFWMFSEKSKQKNSDDDEKKKQFTHQPKIHINKSKLQKLNCFNWCDCSMNCRLVCDSFNRFVVFFLLSLALASHSYSNWLRCSSCWDLLSAGALFTHKKKYFFFFFRSLAKTQKCQRQPIFFLSSFLRTKKKITFNQSVKQLTFTHKKCSQIKFSIEFIEFEKSLLQFAVVKQFKFF